LFDLGADKPISRNLFRFKEAAMIRIFTDGSAIGNPGTGGWAAVPIQGRKRWEISGAEPWTTIEEMELLAAVEVLRSL
jgi:ribonuclease HI